MVESDSYNSDVIRVFEGPKDNPYVTISGIKDGKGNSMSFMVTSDGDSGIGLFIRGIGSLDIQLCTGLGGGKNPERTRALRTEIMNLKNTIQSGISPQMPVIEREIEKKIHSDMGPSDLTLRVTTESATIAIEDRAEKIQGEITLDGDQFKVVRYTLTNLAVALQSVEENFRDRRF